MVLQHPQRMSLFACLQDCLLTLTCHFVTDSVWWYQTVRWGRQSCPRHRATSQTLEMHSRASCQQLLCSKTVTQFLLVQVGTLEVRKIEFPVKVLFELQTPENDGQQMIMCVLCERFVIGSFSHLLIHLLVNTKDDGGSGYNLKSNNPSVPFIDQDHTDRGVVRSHKGDSCGTPTPKNKIHDLWDSTFA